LHGAEVLGVPIDQRRLGPSHRVRPVVGAVQPQFVNPMPKDPGVLPGPEMGRVVEAAREQEVLRLQRRFPDPCLHGLASGLRDLELHRALGLVLHDDGAWCHLVAMAHVPDLEGNEVASPQLAIDAQVEEREFAYAAFHLKVDAQRPDVLQLEGRLLPDDLALVPRLAMSGIACGATRWSSLPTLFLWRRNPPHAATVKCLSRSLFVARSLHSNSGSKCE